MHQSSHKKIIRVVIAIIWNEGLDEILISRRLDSKDFAGFWEFPGGKTEIMESDTQTLDREINEELGILINDFSHRMDHTHEYQNQIIEFTVYDIYSYEGTIEGREGQEIKWIPIDTINADDFPPADIHFIKHIQQHRA